jgi:hypothetical protein
MGRKNKKKSTASSVSPSPPSSEPSPASIEPAQPPPTSSISEDPRIIEVDGFEEKIRKILGDKYHDYERSLAFIPDRQNVTLLRLAKFFKVAYVLGQSSMDREKDEARAEGILEGKNTERSKWVGEGHAPGTECKANRNERMSVAVETNPVPASPSTTFPSPTTTMVTGTQSIHTGEKPQPLSWADKMEDVPIHSIITASSAATSRRDLSILRSESSEPFASLHRRTALSRSQTRSKSFMKYPFSMLPTRRHSRASQFTSRLGEKTSQPHSKSHSRYDWSSGLMVLSDLARALGDMGWKPPDFVYRAV